MSLPYSNSSNKASSLQKQQQSPQLLLSKQTITYLLHQLQSLREVSNKLTGNNVNNVNNINFTIQQIREQIQQRVYLMEKRLEFRISGDGNRQQGEFEDFVTMFYQEEIKKVRAEMVVAKERVSKLERVLKQQQQQQQQQIKYQQQTYQPVFYQQTITSNNNTTNNNPTLPTLPTPTPTISSNTNLLLIQQRQLSTKLRKQLSHCQQLIQQNQQFISQQNLLIKQLTQQILQIQQRQSVLRTNSDELVIKYDQKINENLIKYKQIQKQFVQKRKLYEKQLKQLQINNARFYEQRQSLQCQVITKSQQITLLTKKIYQLEIVVNKYQRQVTNKVKQNAQSDQAILLLNDEMLLWKQRYYEVESGMGLKVKEVQQERDRVENERKERVKELEELKRKVSGYYQLNEVNNQRKLRQLQQKLTISIQHSNNLQQQLQATTKRLQQKQLSLKKHQKLLTTKQQQLQQLNQHIKELQQQLKKTKYKHVQMNTKQNEQKVMMKKQIYSQVEELLRINNETVKRMRVQEVKILELSKQLQEKQLMVRELKEIANKLEILNQEITKRNKQLMIQVEQRKDIIKQMQHQLLQKTGKQQQIDKYIKDTIQKGKLLKQLQKKCNKLLSQKQQLLQQVQQLRQYKEERQLEQKLQQRQSFNNNNNNNNYLLTQQITVLKQQHCKKDFMIKQLQSKINILQEQLREVEEVKQVEREKMGSKIKQLEELLKERYDFSNRPSNEG